MEPELQAMIDFVEHGPEVYRPGPFWVELGRAHTELLSTHGYENFKRTINIRYFDWRPLGIIRHQFLAVAREWARRPRWDVFSATLSTSPFNPLFRWVYRTYVAMYSDLLRQRDPLDLLSTIHEPPIGRPFLVSHRGVQLSQDICNSVHEFYSIYGPDVDRMKRVDVCELGAGYGRLAYVTLRALPASTYCIVDIPPSLYLSQRYLSEMFPDAKVFRFRPFEKFEDVREEFEAARIRFLASSQIELLPPKMFDQVVNISSLHEMTRPQVETYFTQIDRVCRGQMYTKQFRTHRAQVHTSLRREESAFREGQYPISWRVVYHRVHPIQRLFFDALYQVPATLSKP